MNLNVNKKTLHLQTIYSMFIIYILSCIFFPMVADCKVVEKKGRNYFDAGSQQFELNEAGEISPAAANKLLSRLQVQASVDYPYSRETVTSSGYWVDFFPTKEVESTWEYIDEVYSGELLDELVFQAMRGRINAALNALRSPASRDESWPKREGKNFYGRLVTVTKYDETVESRNHYQDSYPYKKTELYEYYTHLGVNRPFLPWKAISEAGSVDRNRIRPGDIEEAKRKGRDLAWSSVEKMKEKLRDEAIEAIIGRISSDISEFRRRTPNRSKGVEDSFQELLMALPRYVLSLSKDCGGDTAHVVASQLTTIALANAESNVTRNDLIKFGEENSLNYERKPFSTNTPRGL